MTAAHDQRTTIHILAHIPDHAPREDDPHYRLFEQAKARIKRQGLWKCALSDDLCGGQLELHHSHVEFSQANAADPAKIEQAFGLHFESDEAFQQWIESPSNLEVLCLPGDEEVVMADGTLRAIANVAVGDRVLGHDGESHPVVSTTVSEFSGTVIEVDGRRMTANHPVLTERGWLAAGSLRAGDLACFMAPADAGGHASEFGVLDADVLSVGGVQAQILRAIVVPDVVDVMDGLSALQDASEHALHDEPMFHDEAATPKGPVDDSDIPGWLRISQGAGTATGAGARVKGYESARVRAEGAAAAVDLAGRKGEPHSAGVAILDRTASPATTATLRVALPAACDIPLGKISGHEVVLAADPASLDDHHEAAPFERRWRPILHVSCLPFIGKVYDIEVQGSHSFCASGLVVHNCVNHHRTHYGVHVLPSALWEAVRWHRAGQPAPAEFVAAKDVPA